MYVTIAAATADAQVDLEAARVHAAATAARLRIWTRRAALFEGTPRAGEAAASLEEAMSVDKTAREALNAAVLAVAALRTHHRSFRPTLATTK